MEGKHAQSLISFLYPRRSFVVPVGFDSLACSLELLPALKTHLLCYGLFHWTTLALV